MTLTRIGRHINISCGFLAAPDYAKKLKCTVFQIFLGSPRMIISKKKSDQDLIEFGLLLKENKQKMVIHGSYVINFANPIGSKKYNDSVKSLTQDLNSSLLIGTRCIGVIIHMGKNVKNNNINEKEAYKNYITGLKQVLKTTDKKTTIILETGASQGTEIGSCLDDLQKIYNKLTSNEKKRVKFCIDTCHIWATGYDIASIKGVTLFFNEFNKRIGIKNIACIHFNDSKTSLHSCVDRHADLEYGKINVVGLRAVAHFAVKNKIPLIMETPIESVNMKTNVNITSIDEINKVTKWCADI